MYAQKAKRRHVKAVLDPAVSLLVTSACSARKRLVLPLIISSSAPRLRISPPPPHTPPNLSLHSSPASMGDKVLQF
eukprot:6068142-Amphidinium_carterae.1